MQRSICKLSSPCIPPPRSTPRSKFDVAARKNKPMPDLCFNLCNQIRCSKACKGQHETPQMHSRQCHLATPCPHTFVATLLLTLRIHLQPSRILPAAHCVRASPTSAPPHPVQSVFFLLIGCRKTEHPGECRSPPCRHHHRAAGTADRAAQRAPQTAQQQGRRPQRQREG